MSALSLCSAFTSVSEGVFLMYPWKEIYSMSTYSSATLFSVLFFMVSFAVQNLYVWLAPICLFSFLFFTALEEEIDLRKCWHSLCQKIFFLCSLLGILWCCLSCLMFKSLSHFELSFVYGVTECSDFSDLHVALSSFLNTTCCGGFSPLYICASLVKD